MSRKQIYGITLTAEEKRMAGYDRASGFARTTTSAPAPKPQYAGLTSHPCQVTLPDGTECRVDYACYGGGGSHTFTFHSPLSEREYGNGSLADIPSIEARAQELVGRVWRKAQDAEQKTMRLPSAPSNLVHTLDKTPQLTRKTAQRFAGLYAVCLRYPSGTLTPLAAACERRAEALSDLERMQAQSKQTLVIGICCLWARRWQEPRFLMDAPAAANMSGTVEVMTGSMVEREEADTNANGSRTQHEEEEEEQAWEGDEDEEAGLDKEDPDEEPDQPDSLDDDPDEDDEDEEDPDDPFEGT